MTNRLPIGPWQVDCDVVEALVDPENSQTYYAPLCVVDSDWHHEVRYAIATAISSIPDMLAVLDEAQQALDTLSQYASNHGHDGCAMDGVTLAMRIRELTNTVRNS